MTVIVSIVLGFLPGFAWLFFYLKEDLHPEPKRLIIFTFFIGIVSAFVALIIEKVLNGPLPQKILDLQPPLSGSHYYYLIAIALIEETVKYGAVYFAVHKSPYFDEPVDAMIYMIVGALGFATVENLGAVSTIAENSVQTALISNVITASSLRFVGATLLHSLTAGIIGYYWATGIRGLNSRKYVFYGLAVATGLHALFNYLIINLGSVVFIAIFLMVVGFFVLSDFEKLKHRAV